MPHIDLPKEYPGIRSLFMYRPETAAPLNALVQTLLHNPHPTLSPGERELIAAYVSGLNACKYCTTVHGAIAKHHLNNNAALVADVIADPSTAVMTRRTRFCLCHRSTAGAPARRRCHRTDPLSGKARPCANRSWR